jgi:membrane-bound lytic murein transglycosylase MltF
MRLIAALAIAGIPGVGPDARAQPAAANRGLFPFASYNAGPGRVQQLREAARKRGLDPHVWFDNVELIAAEKIGRETVQYVSNISKDYVAYTLIQEDEEARRKALGELEKKAS